MLHAILHEEVIQVEERGACEHQQHEQQHDYAPGHPAYELSILASLRLLLAEAALLKKLPAHVLIVLVSIVVISLLGGVMDGWT